MIIGLTGTYSSGKDLVAGYLVSWGFEHFSLSDMLREESRRRGVKPNRDVLINLGNELRAKEGYSTLAQRALLKTAGGGDYVISSIRHSEEAKLLLQKNNFYLVNVDAPIEKRFGWFDGREREEDDAIKTLADLEAYEAREMATEGPGQQLGLVRQLANETIWNDGSKQELENMISAIVSRLRAKGI